MVDNTSQQLHGTNLPELAKTKTELWDIMNSSFKCIEFLIDEFRREFEGYSVNYCMKNMNITLTNPGDIVESPNQVINSRILSCFKNAIESLYFDNRISEELYNNCNKNVNLLFNLVLNHNNCIVINL